MKRHRPKLRADQVRRELELLACGADGARVVLDENSECPTLTQYLQTESLHRFATAVRQWFFPEDLTARLLLFGMSSLPDWQDFDTLAQAVIEERHRLDRLADEEADA